MKGASGPSATVFVVDDDPDIRAAVALLVKSVRLPVRTYADAGEFLAGWDPAERGCLVLDVRMPGMSGLELQNALKARGLDIPIVFLSGHGDIPMALRAVRDGAVDFLEKPFRDQSLIDAVHAALSEDESRRRARKEGDRVASLVGSLSPREAQVAGLVASGRSSPEIARSLRLSPRTVEMHRARAMKRLGVDGVAGLTSLILAARGVPGGAEPVAASPSRKRPSRRKGARG